MAVSPHEADQHHWPDGKSGPGGAHLRRLRRHAAGRRHHLFLRSVRIRGGAGGRSLCRGHRPPAGGRLPGGRRAVPGTPRGTEPDAELFRYAEEFSARASGLSNRLAELSAQYESKDRDASQFRHFFGLDIDLDKVLACENIKVRFGRLPNESFERLKLYNDNPFVLFFPAVREEEYCWGVYFAPFDQAEEVDRIFPACISSGCVFPPLWDIRRRSSPICAGSRRRFGSREQCRKEITDFWERESPPLYGGIRLAADALLLFRHPALRGTAPRQIHPYRLGARPGGAGVLPAVGRGGGRRIRGGGPEAGPPAFPAGGVAQPPFVPPL